MKEQEIQMREREIGIKNEELERKERENAAMMEHLLGVLESQQQRDNQVSCVLVLCMPSHSHSLFSYRLKKSYSVATRFSSKSSWISTPRRLCCSTEMRNSSELSHSRRMH